MGCKDYNYNTVVLWSNFHAKCKSISNKSISLLLFELHLYIKLERCLYVTFSALLAYLHISYNRKPKTSHISISAFSLRKGFTDFVVHVLFYTNVKRLQATWNCYMSIVKVIAAAPKFVKSRIGVSKFRWNYFSLFYTCMKRLRLLGIAICLFLENCSLSKTYFSGFFYVIFDWFSKETGAMKTFSLVHTLARRLYRLIKTILSPLKRK